MDVGDQGEGELRRMSVTVAEGRTERLERRVAELEHLVEELAEKVQDLLDAQEMDRLLSDPSEVPIPYEQVREELGLA